MFEYLIADLVAILELFLVVIVVLFFHDDVAVLAPQKEECLQRAVKQCRVERGCK